MRSQGRRRSGRRVGAPDGNQRGGGDRRRSPERPGDPSAAADPDIGHIDSGQDLPPVRSARLAPPGSRERRCGCPAGRGTATRPARRRARRASCRCARGTPGSGAATRAAGARSARRTSRPRTRCRRRVRTPGGAPRCAPAAGAATGRHQHVDVSARGRDRADRGAGIPGEAGAAIEHDTATVSRDRRLGVVVKSRRGGDVSRSCPARAALQGDPEIPRVDASALGVHDERSVGRNRSKAVRVQGSAGGDERTTGAQRPADSREACVSPAAEALGAREQPPSAGRHVQPLVEAARGEAVERGADVGRSRPRLSRPRASRARRRGRRAGTRRRPRAGRSRRIRRSRGQVRPRTRRTGCPAPRRPRHRRHARPRHTPAPPARPALGATMRDEVASTARRRRTAGAIRTVGVSTGGGSQGRTPASMTKG